MTTLAALASKLAAVGDQTLPVVFGGDVYKAYAEKLPDGHLWMPSRYCSYRGYYLQPALVPTAWSGKGPWTDVDDLCRYTINAIGETFTGWKGGAYTMEADSPVWVAMEGDAPGLALLDVVEAAGRVVLVTYDVSDY